MSLENALREAAAKGLTHVTMWPVPSQDRKTTYWYCRATPSSQHSYVQAQHTDPVEAMKMVLDSLPKASKIKKQKHTPPLGYAEAAELTAPVSGDALHQEHMQDIDNTLNQWLPKG